MENRAAGNGAVTLNNIEFPTIKTLNEGCFIRTKSGESRAEQRASQKATAMQTMIQVDGNGTVSLTNITASSNPSHESAVTFPPADHGQSPDYLRLYSCKFRSAIVLTTTAAT